MVEKLIQLVYPFKSKCFGDFERELRLLENVFEDSNLSLRVPYFYSEDPKHDFSNRCNFLEEIPKFEGCSIEDMIKIFDEIPRPSATIWVEGDVLNHDLFMKGNNFGITVKYANGMGYPDSRGETGCFGVYTGKPEIVFPKIRQYLEQCIET